MAWPDTKHKACEVTTPHEAHDWHYASHGRSRGGRYGTWYRCDGVWSGLSA